jgi:hypothetical protein
LTATYNGAAQGRLMTASSNGFLGVAVDWLSGDAMLGRGRCPTDEDFQAITTLPVMPALTPPTSVYQELMGAGGLSSIERKDVRAHVAAFHSDLEWVQKQIDYFRSIRDAPVPVSDPRVRTDFDPTKDEPEVSTFDGKALCADRGFKNRVATATRAHTVFLSYFEGPLDDAISMCVRMADSLGYRRVPSFGGQLKRGRRWDRRQSCGEHAQGAYVRLMLLLRLNGSFWVESGR